jgi:hypothetical protein
VTKHAKARFVTDPCLEYIVYISNITNFGVFKANFITLRIKKLYNSNA